MAEPEQRPGPEDSDPATIDGRSRSGRTALIGIGEAMRRACVVPPIALVVSASIGWNMHGQA